VVEEDRLNKLAAFQLMMIKHAMKCEQFGKWWTYIDQLRPSVPSVQKIVYSTCSIHATENEHVVRSALQSDEARSRSFKLAPRSDVLPTWHRRGQAEEMMGTGKYVYHFMYTN
jgi:putative methyltransferase